MMRLEMKHTLMAGVSVPALLSIATIVFLFIVLGSGLVAAPGVAVELPRTTAGVSVPEHAVVIMLTRGGVVYLQGAAVSPGDFTGKLSALLKASSERAVQLRVDRRAPLQQALQLLEQARAAGATRLTIATEPARE
jgi:biopolymer transport protein ExbD